MPSLSFFCFLVAACRSQIEIIDRDSAYIIGSGSIQCSSTGYTECIINCNVAYACGCSTGQYCVSIQGPSVSHIGFTLNCKTERACYFAEIDASQVSTMILNVYGGDEAARNVFISPPRWITNNLTVNVLQDNSGFLYHNVFSDITIKTRGVDTYPSLLQIE